LRREQVVPHEICPLFKPTMSIRKDMMGNLAMDGVTKPLTSPLTLIEPNGIVVAFSDVVKRTYSKAEKSSS
jgi:hypothetical protein